MRQYHLMGVMKKFKWAIVMLSAMFALMELYVMLTLQENYFIQPRLSNNVAISSSSPSFSSNKRKAVNQNNEDYSTLFNITNFQFIINNQDICNNDGVPLFLTIFVHSAVGNGEKRGAIRETWGNADRILKFFAKTHNKIRLVFLLGISNDTLAMDNIVAENGEHGDIVQGNFIDSYRNLTYKHVMGLKWITYHCWNTRYILKADDDIFVDLYQLVYYLKGTVGDVSLNYMACCDYNPSSYAIRTHRSKWRVSFHEYPDSFYPKYCSGWAIIMSPDVVLKLYAIYHNNSYFWIDDVFVSGLLAQKLNITHTDMSENVNFRESTINAWLESTQLTLPPLFSSPNTKAQNILQLWNKTAAYYKSHYNFDF